MKGAFKINNLAAGRTLLTNRATWAVAEAVEGVPVQ